MKVMFLDHDGVISLSSEPYDGTLKSLKFNPKAVKVLNEILTEVPDVEIVVSSDWRHYFSLPMMRELYKEQGVIKQPIGYTRPDPEYSGSILYAQARISEINYWLKQHYMGLIPVYGWVAIDDMDLSLLGDNFIRTPRPTEGIKQSGIKEKIIKILTKYE